MNRYKKWAEREYSARQRSIALFLLGLLFVVAIPLFLVFISPDIDRWLHLPTFSYGVVNLIVALIFIVAGLLFSLWSIQVQFSTGRGTPAPMMPTQKLVIRRPYTYCRNPMSLGTIVLYLGIAIWIGSIAAVILTLLFAAFLVIYNRLLEERELEERFGPEYLEYKRKTPFIMPRPWRTK